MKVYILAKSDVRFLANSCRENIAWTLVVARIPYYKLTHSKLVPIWSLLQYFMHEYQNITEKVGLNLLVKIYGYIRTLFKL